jgi:serine/threonine-protein kinase
MSTAAATIDWEQKRRELMGQRDARALPPWVKLPAFPAALMEFIRKSQDPDVGADQLGRIIEKDCGLTAFLLKSVNASAAGFREQVRTAQEAIVRLGIRTATLLLTTAQSSQLMKASQSKVVNARGFYCSNLERALFARNVARLWKLDDDLAFAGAMLADALIPTLTNQAASVYLQFLGIEHAPPRICEFENREFGWNHAEAAAYLFAAWQFPPDLVCCVYLHHKGLEILKDPCLRQTGVAAVSVAGLLPDQLRQEPGGLALLQRMQQAQPQFDIQELAHAVETQFRELEPAIENPFPLARRLRRTQA